MQMTCGRCNVFSYSGAETWITILNTVMHLACDWHSLKLYVTVVVAVHFLEVFDINKLGVLWHLYIFLSFLFIYIWPPLFVAIYNDR